MKASARASLVMGVCIEGGSDFRMCGRRKECDGWKVRWCNGCGIEREVVIDVGVCESAMD